MGIVAKAQLDVEWDGSGLAAADRCNVYVDSVRANDSPLPAWPELENHDGYGWGQGRWGMGGWGLGGDLAEFATPPVADGARTVGVTTVDEAGNESAAVEAAVLVAAVPKPPADLAAGDYTGGVLELTFELSGDDDAA